LFAEPVNRGGRAFRNGFDSAVGKVADCANDAGLASLSNGKVPEADPLNTTSYYKSSSYHLRPLNLPQEIQRWKENRSGQGEIGGNEQEQTCPLPPDPFARAPRLTTAGSFGPD